MRQAASNQLEELNSIGFDFVSLGLYVDGKSSPNFYIKSVDNLQTASANYVGAISGGGSEATDVTALKSFLNTSGIHVKESPLQTVKTVMQNAIIV